MKSSGRAKNRAISSNNSNKSTPLNKTSRRTNASQ